MLSTQYNNPLFPSRQVQINKKYRRNPLPKQQNIKNIRRFIEELSNTAQLVLDYFLRYKAKYKVLHMAQQSIADEVGRSREEVNRSLQELARQGLISIWFRSYNTCFYWLSSIFKQLKVRNELRYLFPVLLLPVSLILSLLSTPAQEPSDQRAHTIYKHKLSYNSFNNNGGNISSLDILREPSKIDRGEPSGLIIEKYGLKVEKAATAIKEWVRKTLEGDAIRREWQLWGETLEETIHKGRVLTSKQSSSESVDVETLLYYEDNERYNYE